MLTIDKLTAGVEAYFCDTVARGREEYYVGTGESPGRWLGRGSARLGLEGEVAPGELRLVLAGFDPGSARSLAQGRVAPERRVAGFDLTFSAPKSVSLLYAFGTEEHRHAVRRAHEEAVRSTLGYLEDHAAGVRRGAGGTTKTSAEGFVASSFVHRTSRNGDPQLHSHVLVANLARGEDGRWSALDASLLYAQYRSAGSLYQAALRVELAESLGVRFGPVKHGPAEIEGISPELRGAFSSRRAQILEELALRGESSPQAAERAALATRPKKEHAVFDPDGPGLHERWRTMAQELGVDADAVPSVVGPPRRVEIALSEERALVRRLLSPTGLTARASTFERHHVVRAVAESLPDGARVRDVEALAERVLGDAQVTKLAQKGRDGKAVMTTKELLEVEDRLVGSATGRRSGQVARVDERRVRRVLERRPELSEEQRRMVRRLTTEGHGVDGVVGRAGSGKTTALRAANEAFTDAGHRVTGLALSARAAEGLQKGAGLPSLTLARFDHELETGRRRLDSKDVLVVDEAGMIGTRDLDRLLRHAEQAGSKVILVGDPRQLPEISAGGAFRALSERLSMPELTVNRRQLEAWEREALDDLRHGDVREGVSAYVGHDRVHLGSTRDDTRHQMVETWRRVTADTDGQVVMLAASRADVRALNDLARQVRRAEGRLGEDLPVPGPRPFAVGDEVVALRNDAELAVLNGTRGTVKGLSDEGLVIATEGGERVLPAGYMAEGHLDHGYATTVHKAQGLTCDRALVLGGQGLSRELGYVAMSRARAGTDLFVPTSVIEDGHAKDDELGALAARLGRSRAKELASEHLSAEELEQVGAPVEREAAEAPPLPAPFEEPDICFDVVPPEERRPVPDHVVAVLGPAPLFVDERQVYDHLAGRITEYRKRHGATDEEEGVLGPRPSDWKAALEYDGLQQMVERYLQRRERVLPEPPSRERGLER